MGPDLIPFGQNAAMATLAMYRRLYLLTLDAAIAAGVERKQLAGELCDLGHEAGAMLDRRLQ